METAIPTICPKCENCTCPRVDKGSEYCLSSSSDAHCICESANVVTHTPGPWYAEKEKNHRHVICSIGDFFICTNETPQDIEADARLIAAAPEILDILKMTYDNISHREGDCFSDDYRGLCICGKDKVGELLAKLLQ